MSDAGLESTTGKTPEWETRLWRYISTGNGMSCPLQGSCQVKKAGGWCPNDNKERINQVLDEPQTSIERYNFIKSEVYKFY